VLWLAVFTRPLLTLLTTATSTSTTTTTAAGDLPDCTLKERAQLLLSCAEESSGADIKQRRKARKRHQAQVDDERTGAWQNEHQRLTSEGGASMSSASVPLNLHSAHSLARAAASSPSPPQPQPQPQPRKTPTALVLDRVSRKLLQAIWRRRAVLLGGVVHLHACIPDESDCDDNGGAEGSAEAQDDAISDLFPAATASVAGNAAASTGSTSPPVSSSPPSRSHAWRSLPSLKQITVQRLLAPLRPDGRCASFTKPSSMHPLRSVRAAAAAAAAPG
jgi:hypothetical protein